MASDESGKVYIVPTSHASEESEDHVADVIDSMEPDVVAIELGPKRYQKLKEWEGSISPRSLSLRAILSRSSLSHKSKIILGLFSLIQSRLTSKLGIDLLGIDMLSGINAAEEEDIPVVLVDRDIHETLNRFSDEVGFYELLRFIGYMLASYVKLGRQEAETVEEEIQVDKIDIDEVLDALDKLFPTFKRVFIDERDEIMAERVSSIVETGESVVLVVGAGHSVGIRRRLEDNVSNNVQLLERAVKLVQSGSFFF